MKPRLSSLLLAGCAAFVVGTADAQQKLRGWHFIGQYESGVTQYIDMTTIRKERGFVRVRILGDHKTPIWGVTSERILSEVDEHYVDCQRRAIALLAAASYECNMARCNPAESSSYKAQPLDWIPIPRHMSLSTNVFDLVCQK